MIRAGRPFLALATRNGRDDARKIRTSLKAPLQDQIRNGLQDRCTRQTPVLDHPHSGYNTEGERVNNLKL